MSTFGLKFIDVMIGIILGLGFQWWPELQFGWQYAAFIFVYIDIVDYWIDYYPSLKRWPPKREMDFMLDVAIMFSLFLYIYSTQLSLELFLLSFALARFLDFLWCIRALVEHEPKGNERTFVTTWIRMDLLEVVITLALVAAALHTAASDTVLLCIFVAVRLLIRVIASMRYKRVHFE